MPTSRRDNARGQAGEVGKANGSQRRNSTASGFPSESLPPPVAACQPHITTTGEAQCRRSVSSAAQRYEALKSDIIRQCLSPAEYGQACRRAARKAGL